MKVGARIANAYLALAVDGDGINKDIVDSVDDAGPGVEKAGKEHGDAYGENFNEGFFSRIRGKIRKGLDKDLGDAGENAGDSVGKRLEKSLSRASDKIGSTLGERIADSLEDKLEMSLANMIDTLDTVSKSGGSRTRASTSISPDKNEPGSGTSQILFKVATKFEAARVKLREKSNDEILKSDEKLVKTQQALYDSILKAEADKSAFLAKFEMARTKMREKSNDVILNSDERLLKAQQKIFDEAEKDARRRITLQQKAFDSYAKNLPDANGKRGGVSGNRGKDSDPGSRIGKIFGARSRNDGLNILGRTVGGLSGLIFKATGAASKMFSTFKKGFDQAAAGATGVQKVVAGLGGVASSAGGGLAKGFSGLAASGPAALVAVVAVGAALMVVVSIASALLGVVVALSATIASGLTAAVLVGAGAFAALGAAAGLATIAFRSMTDEQKNAMKETFEPLHEMVTGLGRIMLKDMIPAFAKWSENLQVALGLIKPLAEVMGGAFARAGIILTNALSGKGIQLFIDALGETLPRIVTNLSNAFGKFLNGVSSVFAALMPSVLRFSEYLSKVATDFAKWASSAKGQSSIKDFVDRAIDSLKSLWGFIKATGAVLAEFLFSEEGQKAGNSIFDKMSKGLRKFADYVSEEGRLEDWFTTAEEFAEDLGDAIKLVSKILKDLNDSKVIDGLGGLITIAEKAYSAWDAMPDAITGLINPINMLLTPIKILISAFDILQGQMDSVSNFKMPDYGNVTDGAGLTAPGMAGAGKAAAEALLPTGVPSGGGSTGSSTAGMDALINAGKKALAVTSEENGGHMPEVEEALEKVKKAWKNPYIKFAKSILEDAPKLADEILASAEEASKALRDALRDALALLTDALRDGGAEMVDAITDAAKPLGLALNAAYDELFNTEGLTPNAGSAAVQAGLAVTTAFNSQIESLRSSMSETIQTAKDSAKDLVTNATAARSEMIASAESAVQAAASALAGATSKADAKAALAALSQAQADLAVAKKAGDKLLNDAEQSAQKLLDKAEEAKDRTAIATRILESQGVLTLQNAVDLANGLKVQGATLADYATARAAVADRLAAANQKLSEAIALRDNYNSQVADSVRSFGSLMTAQAKVIDGVTQALTAGDITENLRDRLGKVKAFQENLRVLLAQGLSQSAYKQLVDAGVESGGAFAQAILEGGAGAVSEVNNLSGQIDDVAAQLGGEASSQLYQAGVDAAQGLVDGLMSLSAELDSAAAELGEAIAEAVKRALGIASPSKVMRGMMAFVGDGAAEGLDDQHKKIGDAATRFSDAIAVSPEVAAYAAQQGAPVAPTGTGSEAVSGNQSDPRFRDLIIHTPTEDPRAVAMETLNEITGAI